MKKPRINESKIHTLPKPEKNIYIYTLNCPYTDKVMYVGLATNGFSRIKQHYNCNIRRSPSAIKKWIYELRKQNQIFNIKYVQYFDKDGPHVDEAEIALIKHYKDNNYRLLNADLGGRRDYKNFNSEEAKKIMSERGKSVNGTPEQRKLFSDKAKAQWANPETRERILASRKAKKGSKDPDNIVANKRKAQVKACGVKIQDDLGNVFQSMQEAADYYKVIKSVIQRALYSKTSLLGDRKLTRIGGGKKPIDKLAPVNRYIKLADRKINKCLV